MFNCNFLTLCFICPQAPFPSSASFNQEVETALESFDFLNFSDVEEEEEQQQQEKEELEGRCEEDQNKTQQEKILEEKDDEENVCSEGRLVSAGGSGLSYSFTFMIQHFTELQRPVPRSELKLFQSIPHYGNQDQPNHDSGLQLANSVQPGRILNP